LGDVALDEWHVDIDLNRGIPLVLLFVLAKLLVSLCINILVGTLTGGYGFGAAREEPQVTDSDLEE
jgi:hypothetical protein